MQYNKANCGYYCFFCGKLQKCNFPFGKVIKTTAICGQICLKKEYYIFAENVKDTHYQYIKKAITVIIVVFVDKLPRCLILMCEMN